MIQTDQIYFLCSVLISIPLSALFRSIPQNPKFKWIKHAYSILYAFIITKIVYFDTAIWYCLIPAMIVWAVGFIVNRYKVSKRTRLYVLISTWVTGFCYLSAFHINRMLVNWTTPISQVDITTMQMMLIVKLTQFMTDVYHSKGYLEKYPSLLEWIGYICFIPSFLVGPVLKLDEYQNYIKHNTCHPTPTPIARQINVLNVKAVVLGMLTVIGIWKFSLFHVVDLEFASYRFPTKLLYLYISIVLVRCKYYFMWTLAEIEYIASGSSPFVSHKGRNIDIVGIEMAQNTHTILSSWNISTNMWLKDTVYSQITDFGYSKNIGVLATNITSAIWHGFYPGYYIAFLVGGISTILGRMWRQNISKYIQKTQNQTTIKYYNYVKVPVMALILMFAGSPFILCDLRYSMTFFIRFRWYGYILMLIGFGIVLLFTRFSTKYQILTDTKDE